MGPHRALTQGQGNDPRSLCRTPHRRHAVCVWSLPGGPHAMCLHCCAAGHSSAPHAACTDTHRRPRSSTDRHALQHVRKVRHDEAKDCGGLLTGQGNRIIELQQEGSKGAMCAKAVGSTPREERGRDACR